MRKLHFNVHDIKGRRFGRLVAKRYFKGSMWLCSCDCGGSKRILARRLMNGTTRSCGCLQPEVTAARCRTHGEPRDKAYRTWARMFQRCKNPRHLSYKNYGGRGITICERWRSYAAFLADMGRPPSAAMTIDRINNDGNYEPGNCRWATHEQQGRNTRRVRYVEFRGQKVTIPELAERFDISYQTLIARLNRGWPAELAATKPPDLGFRYGKLLC